ncbi:hypothetical protein ACIG56_21860 [Nocardia fusca]|uniref:hypothetical protein n=1 Tax=Nocardia fusca TaxID=941183 RepID=UPI0037C716C1
MKAPTPLPIVLIGYGPVARNYAAVLRARRAEFRGRYLVDPYLVAIRARDGRIYTPDGGVPPDRPRWPVRTPIEDLLAGTAPAVVAQAVPSHPDGAAEALAAGAHLVTATKSPLLSGWSRLHTVASEYGWAVRISGATGAALPAGDLARAGLRGVEVQEVRGCVNGTASFVPVTPVTSRSPGAGRARSVRHSRWSRTRSRSRSTRRPGSAEPLAAVAVRLTGCRAAGTAWR